MTQLMKRKDECMNKILIDRSLAEMIERTWRATLGETVPDNVVHALIGLRIALARPDAAQDEREAFESWAKSTPHGSQLRYVRDALPTNDPRYGEYVSEALRLSWEAWQARATRPAQTEQQPVAVIGFYEGEREPRLLSWNKLPNGEHRLYAAPIAQTALSAVTAERDRLRASKLYWVAPAGSGLVRCVTDERYRKFSPSIRAKYDPVCCVDTAMAAKEA